MQMRARAVLRWLRTGQRTFYAPGDLLVHFAGMRCQHTPSQKRGTMLQVADFGELVWQKVVAFFDAARIPGRPSRCRNWRLNDLRRVHLVLLHWDGEIGALLAPRHRPHAPSSRPVRLVMLLARVLAGRTCLVNRELRDHKTAPRRHYALLTEAAYRQRQAWVSELTVAHLEGLVRLWRSVPSKPNKEYLRDLSQLGLPRLPISGTPYLDPDDPDFERRDQKWSTECQLSRRAGGRARGEDGPELTAATLGCKLDCVQQAHADWWAAAITSLESDPASMFAHRPARKASAWSSDRNETIRRAAWVLRV